MAESTKGGVYIPEWVWKALQSLLLAAVIGVYGMLYNMHDSVNKLELQVAALEDKTAHLEGKLEEREKVAAEIRETLASINAELPFIKQGINDLKVLLR